jgi:riboflavin biosynthesis pyrimidine reductase
VESALGKLTSINAAIAACELICDVLGPAGLETARYGELVSDLPGWRTRAGPRRSCATSSGSACSDSRASRGPTRIVSTTLKDPEWNNTTVLDGGKATAEVHKLKEEFDGELQVPGRHRLVQELIESDLVDQLNLMVFPVVLGTGKRALEETSERRNLRLKESKVVGDGVVVLI